MFRLVPLIKAAGNRLRFAIGVAPLSQQWGDRGQPLSRDYVEEFLQQFSRDIRGHCLEFQEDTYTSRFGRDAVTKLDILHREPGNPNATIVTDLTQPNTIPSSEFDCIICTYTLHVVFDLYKMISEFHRILKEEGVLLVAVPNITLGYPQNHELWRFMPEGLEALLVSVFGVGNVTIKGYGNSLTSAGNLRGLVAREFSRDELGHHDPRFAIVVMGRAVKTT
jgi:SAM-dependent methyltransferase